VTAAVLGYGGHGALRDRLNQRVLWFRVADDPGDAGMPFAEDLQPGPL
jgi:hypothetical protein